MTDPTADDYVRATAEAFGVDADEAVAYRHEIVAANAQRLENATYTAAEVKVRTEAALRLGRKEALEEAAARCEQDAVYDVAARYHFARITRSLLPREMLGGLEYPPRRDATYPVDGGPHGPQDATSGRTEAPGYSDLPQDSETVRSPQGDPNG